MGTKQASCRVRTPQPLVPSLLTLCKVVREIGRTAPELVGAPTLLTVWRNPGTGAGWGFAPEHSPSGRRSWTGSVDRPARSGAAHGARYFCFATFAKAFEIVSLHVPFSMSRGPVKLVTLGLSPCGDIARDCYSRRTSPGLWTHQWRAAFYLRTVLAKKSCTSHPRSAASGIGSLP